MAALGGLGDAEYARGRMLSANARLRSCVDLCRQHDFGRLAVANHAQVAQTTLYLAPQEDALNEVLGAAEAAARAGYLRAELTHASRPCSRSWCWRASKPAATWRARSRV